MIATLIAVVIIASLRLWGRDRREVHCHRRQPQLIDAAAKHLTSTLPNGTSQRRCTSFPLPAYTGCRCSLNRLASTRSASTCGAWKRWAWSSPLDEPIRPPTAVEYSNHRCRAGRIGGALRDCCTVRQARRAIARPRPVSRSGRGQLCGRADMQRGSGQDACTVIEPSASRRERETSRTRIVVR